MPTDDQMLAKPPLQDQTALLQSKSAITGAGSVYEQLAVRIHVVQTDAPLICYVSSQLGARAGGSYSACGAASVRHQALPREAHRHESAAPRKHCTSGRGPSVVDQRNH